jgi:arylsulfatase A-like enzyme
MLLWVGACVPEPSVSDGPTEGPVTETVVTVPVTTLPTVTTPTSPTTPAGPPSVLQFDGPPPTNLLIISLDTTRRDHIGRFGYLDNTPNLNAILEEGVALDDHRSCSSWTGPSMTCVTTGLTPFDRNWFPWNSDPSVANNDLIPTLAAQLSFQQGFRTSLITANGVMGPYIGLDRGFVSVQNLDYQPAANVTNEALEEALSLVDGVDPFYLHVHFMDPHGPYCPPMDYVDNPYYMPLEQDICSGFGYMTGAFPYETETWRDQFMLNTFEIYDAELDYWDVEFGRLWDGLDAMGALDDTLVMFVTDHGEQFNERGGWGHGIRLGAEENRSTAGFWAKNILPLAWTEPTVHEDLGATLIDYFGTKPLQEVTGVVVGTAPADRAVRGMLYWGGGGQAQLSIILGKTQLTYDFWGEKHFYDFSLDETGLVDYYDPADPDVQASWVHMQAYIDEVLTKWPSAGPANDVGL